MNHLISFNVSENCFICNQFCDFSQSFYALSTILTIHSKKPLQEFIGSIFEAPLPSEDSSICGKCLNKINEFDEYNSKTLELRNELIETREKTKATTTTYQLDIDAIDAFQLNLTNEFNFESDSNGIFIAQENAKLLINNDDGDDEKKTEEEISNDCVIEDFKHLKNDLACVECGIKFRCINSSLIHKASNHDKLLKQIPCWICNKKCATKIALRAHLICHRNVKKFTCYCGKKFMYKISYTQHLKIHENIREFPCEYEACDFKARTATHLKRHVRARHTKEKNHKCEFCGRNFSEKYNLKSHMKKQHGKID